MNNSETLSIQDFQKELEKKDYEIFLNLRKYIFDNWNSLVKNNLLNTKPSFIHFEHIQRIFNSNIFLVGNGKLKFVCNDDRSYITIVEIKNK
jgi:hypothetical protein